MKIGSGKPVVGATLVVAATAIFISLYGLHKAIVILRSPATNTRLSPAGGTPYVVDRSTSPCDEKVTTVRSF